MADGKPGLYMFGHGASLLDPYAAFELFHSRYSASIGTTAGNNRFSRYKNPEYDAILDAMAPLPSDDPEFQELAAQALEIYWRDQIDIPIIQWLHRIPYNQTYWTNWPTADNPAMGTNGAFWAHTGLLVVTEPEAGTVSTSSVGERCAPLLPGRKGYTTKTRRTQSIVGFFVSFVSLW